MTDYERICIECRQAEQAFHLYNDYSAEIQTKELCKDTEAYVLNLLHKDLYSKVLSAVAGIEYRAQRQADKIEEQTDTIDRYKEQSDRQRRQIRYLQDELQAERAEGRLEQEYQKLLNDLQEEKRKRIEAEWKLAVYMIKH